MNKRGATMTGEEYRRQTEAYIAANQAERAELELAMLRQQNVELKRRLRRKGRQ